MVLVDAGTVVGPVAGTFAGETIPAFLIDRHEVTNEAFLAFVADGAYRNPAFWPDSLIMNGRPVPRETGLGGFVDRTGLPGPRTWSGGTFPEGQERHPVTGVSWYEASAYARWAGKQLPTLAQWWRAALGDVDQPYPWGSDYATLDQRANFSMLATSTVDADSTGVSPYGAHAMAGNVREWLTGEDDAEAYPAIGGSWQDPTYMFYTPNIERFPPAFANSAVGFRLVTAVPR
jgi:formylglycine-generating enzyme required for sulfatase activity